MYRNEAYSDAQKPVLRKIAIYTANATKHHKGIEDWKDDIIDSINFFLTELKKHG